MTLEQRYKNHFGDGWSMWLQPFLKTEEFKKIGEVLMNSDEEVCPKLTDVFRCFRECPWRLLHSVIINMSAYCLKDEEGTLQADGLALSSRNVKNPNPTLEAVYQGIKSSIDGTYNPGGVWNYEHSLVGHDLKGWAKQGILLLNMSMTTVFGRENEHMILWRPFIENVIRIINHHKDSVGFVLMGAHTHSVIPIITNKTHQVFTCESPGAAPYYRRHWRHNNALLNLHAFQKQQNNILIEW